MSTTAIENILNAYKWALANRPRVNGYPFLAEALRQAGVSRYVCHLPSCQCLYYTDMGVIAAHGDYLISSMTAVPKFNQEAFVKILRNSQRGEITFTDFLRGTWESGVTYYEADLMKRTVTYFGAKGESYMEEYPSVTISV